LRRNSRHLREKSLANADSLNWTLLSRRHWHDGDYGQALALLQEYLRAQPEDAWIMLDMAESETTSEN